MNGSIRRRKRQRVQTQTAAAAAAAAASASTPIAPSAPTAASSSASAPIPSSFSVSSHASPTGGSDDNQFNFDLNTSYRSIDRIQNAKHAHSKPVVSGFSTASLAGKRRSGSMSEEEEEEEEMGKVFIETRTPLLVSLRSRNYKNTNHHSEEKQNQSQDSLISSSSSNNINEIENKKKQLPKPQGRAAKNNLCLWREVMTSQFLPVSSSAVHNIRRRRRAAHKGAREVFDVRDALGISHNALDSSVLLCFSRASGLPSQCVLAVKQLHSGSSGWDDDDQHLGGGGGDSHNAANIDGTNNRSDDSNVCFLEIWKCVSLKQARTNRIERKKRAEAIKNQCGDASSAAAMTSVDILTFEGGMGQDAEQVGLALRTVNVNAHTANIISAALEEESMLEAAGCAQKPVACVPLFPTHRSLGLGFDVLCSPLQMHIVESPIGSCIVAMGTQHDASIPQNDASPAFTVHFSVLPSVNRLISKRNDVACPKPLMYGSFSCTGWQHDQIAFVRDLQGEEDQKSSMVHVFGCFNDEIISIQMNQDEPYSGSGSPGTCRTRLFVPKDGIIRHSDVQSRCLVFDLEQYAEVIAAKMNGRVIDFTARLLPDVAPGSQRPFQLDFIFVAHLQIRRSTSSSSSGVAQKPGNKLVALLVSLDMKDAGKVLRSTPFLYSQAALSKMYRMKLPPSAFFPRNPMWVRGNSTRASGSGGGASQTPHHTRVEVVARVLQSMARRSCGPPVPLLKRSFPSSNLPLLADFRSIRAIMHPNLPIALATGSS